MKSFTTGIRDTCVDPRQEKCAYQINYRVLKNKIIKFTPDKKPGKENINHDKEKMLQDEELDDKNKIAFRCENEESLKKDAEKELNEEKPKETQKSGAPRNANFLS